MENLEASSSSFITEDSLIKSIGCNLVCSESKHIKILLRTMQSPTTSQGGQKGGEYNLVDSRSALCLVSWMSCTERSGCRLLYPGAMCVFYAALGGGGGGDHCIASTASLWGYAQKLIYSIYLCNSWQVVQGGCAAWQWESSTPGTMLLDCVVQSIDWGALYC